MLSKLHKHEPPLRESPPLKPKYVRIPKTQSRRARSIRGKSIPLKRPTQPAKLNLEVRRKMNESVKLSKKAVRRGAHLRRERDEELGKKEGVGLVGLRMGRLELKRKLAENRFELSNLHSGVRLGFERFPQSTHGTGKEKRLFKPVKSRGFDVG